MANLTYISYLVVGLFLIYMSFREISHSEASVEPKLKSKLSQFAAPTLTVMYCISWGYRQVFEEYATRLRQRYPDLRIEGNNFPAHPIRRYVASFLAMAKLVLIGLVACGYDPFPLFNMETHPVWSWAIQNKIYACMMLFFISNAIEGQLLSTGAFEVTFNGMPIWSKIESGKVPKFPELVQILENTMKLSYRQI